MEMMVNHALTGKMDGYDLGSYDPNFNRSCVALNLFSRGGVVGEIYGLDEISKKKSLVGFDKFYDVGDYIEKSGTLKQLHFKFLFIEDNVQEIKSSIEEIQDTIKVLDDKGDDMLLAPFDINRIDKTLG